MRTRPRNGRRRAVGAVLLGAALLATSGGADPLTDRQYHLRRVRAPDVWPVAKGGGQVIAVLDTGVAADHPDLAGRVLRGIDLVDRGTRPTDRNGHGTFVAGVAVANLRNAEGGAGVAPRANVLPVRVLDEDGMGSSDVVAEGIRWATRRGAHVINLSLADVPGQRRSPAALITNDVEMAIRQAALDGVVVVVAAGNDGRRRTPYADDLPALVVGASNHRDGIWRHSNYDERTLFAPGVNIVSTYVGEPYAAADGTSFAAPVVAAAAALLRQRGLDAQQSRRRLLQTARPVGGGMGRVDVAAALGVVPRVRRTPRHGAAPPDKGGQPHSSSRAPRPIAPPSPVAPPAAPEPPRVSVDEDPPTPRPDTEAPSPERTNAAPPPEPVGREPSPIPVPETTDAPDLAVVEPEEPPEERPRWPLWAVAGLLLGLAVALGGHLTVRRSGG